MTRPSPWSWCRRRFAEHNYWKCTCRDAEFWRFVAVAELVVALVGIAAWRY